MKNETPNETKLNLQEYLALERTKLANERTFFSFLRTSLYMILAGIALLQIQGFDQMKWLGLVSISFSAIILFIGIYRFVRLGRKLKKFYKHKPDEEQFIK
jgi:putative membrane protein